MAELHLREGVREAAMVILGRVRATVVVVAHDVILLKRPVSRLRTSRISVKAAYLVDVLLLGLLHELREVVAPDVLPGVRVRQRRHPAHRRD